MAPEELSESLYLWYKRKLGLWIQRAEARIGVGAVPSWSPVGFPLAPGQVAARVDRVSRDQNGLIPEISTTWYDSATTRYVSRLK